MLIQLSTEVTFTFNSKFCKQTDGCALGGPLSVIFSDMYMTKMERDVIRPFNPIFYHRYVDDIYNREKINKKDESPNEYLQKYQAKCRKKSFKVPRYKIVKFLKLKYTGKKRRYQCIGVLTSLKDIREMQFQ